MLTRLAPVIGTATALALAAACGDQESPLGARAAGRLNLQASSSFPKIETIDHDVAHLSTVPANAGQSVTLRLRERRVTNRDSTKVVLMTHGASVPVHRVSTKRRITTTGPCGSLNPPASP